MYSQSYLNIGVWYLNGGESKIDKLKKEAKDKKN
jgi:hypothetical protein